jgi:hypothetical protein
MATRCALLVLTALLGSCAKDTSTQLFEKLESSATGVTFQNTLREDTTFNILNYLYYYNGGGVAVGDVNNDGLPDLYLTSNLERDRLYLNRGDFRFEDVTERAGVGGQPGWTSGVTMADLNGDGHLDIYVSTVSYQALRGRNVLYINNGDATFVDRTTEFGLEHEGFSTQAAFFDSDNDGDLDVYLLNSSAHSERKPSARPQRSPRHPKAGDRFFRNDNGRFIDVSDQAGIYGGVEGYGLGVVASDLNGDGCVDLYVANDFQENDFLYYNDCKGAFVESVTRSMGHTSQFSMGVDAADFNNDGRPDIAVLDMLPEREEIRKTSATAERLELHQLKMKVGYHAQYARNTLQLNRGGGRFSDIGYLAGVHATDWSWAPLFADLDNDGRKDLFITNGIYRRPNDLDYIAHVNNPVVQAGLARDFGKTSLDLFKVMPQVPLANYAYHNNGDLTFTNRAREWGLGVEGFSNGAAYVDLDNDGDLDLVVNNINAPASIYRNRSRELNRRHYVQVRLRGSGGNTSGIGAKVTLTAGGQTQTLEQMPTRGFQSSVDHRLHFGIDSSARVEQLTVVWPDQRRQTLTNVRVDTVLTLSQADARQEPRTAHRELRPIFTDVTASTGIGYTHIENAFSDFDREPLIPRMLSTEGPALAVGDINGDSLDDVFVSGARGQGGRLFVQQSSGRFNARSVFEPSTENPGFESVDAAFFDADGDKDLDLYVVSGGNEHIPAGDAMRDRLYFNDGRGNFSQRERALQIFFHQGSCVAPGDADSDGDIDLFVGSRSIEATYGATPRSRFLVNDGAGRFTTTYMSAAYFLNTIGMVTDCEWADVTGDGAQDLIIVGEWMSIHVYRQQGRRLFDLGNVTGLQRSTEGGEIGPADAGWWNSLTIADVDGDGDKDFVLGNLGLNSLLKATSAEPLRLYANRFDNNSWDAVLTFYRNGKQYPVAGRDELLAAIPLKSFRDAYQTYASYGKATVEQVLFPPPILQRATRREAFTFASAVALNDGTGKFTLRALPQEAQFAPVYASVVQDFDGDGRVDVLLGGNFYGVTPTRGRYDASYGLMLRGSGGGEFAPVDMEQSGVAITGQVREMRVLRGAKGTRLVAIARNNDSLQILRPMK